MFRNFAFANGGAPFAPSVSKRYNTLSRSKSHMRIYITGFLEGRRRHDYQLPRLSRLRAKKIYAREGEVRPILYCAFFPPFFLAIARGENFAKGQFAAESQSRKLTASWERWR